MTPKNKAAKRLPTCLFSLMLGAGLTLSYAPFGHWFFAPLLLSLLFWQLQHKGREFAFLQGFCFGLGWFGAGISWVHVSIADFGGLPLIASIGLMLLLCAYLALYPALAIKLLVRCIAMPYWPLAIGFLWLLCEWLRSWMLTGFPWLSIGYSQLHGPLGGFLPVIGETGVSVLLITLACALGLMLPKRQYLPALSLIGILVIAGYVLGQQSWTEKRSDTSKLVMVQGNIQQSLRWVPEQDLPTMNLYRRLTQSHWDADLIIWPEAAIPKLEPLALNYLHELDEEAAAHSTALITGIVNYNFESRDAFNNLIVLGSQHGEPQGHYRYPHANRYAKHHLLPIGEFIPFEDWLRGIAPLFDLPMSSFSRGDYQQTNLLANNLRLAPAICFEIAFPAQIRANLHADTDFILTVSNDAWFGHSHGPHQHLEIAQVRAREFGIPVLRATNNGITAIIDANGQVLADLPQFEQGVLVSDVPRYRGQTPYARFGDLWAWLIASVGLLLAIWLPRRAGTITSSSLMVE
ncbi:apolipoprotein N-acyltransferase [Bowmanella denitrificans]|uniref:Apolipoprotein N-acyltransferase n=1 Tax=Bowmanella denitrificans TaxID=366582 RepID=A0ABP3GY95_9ALTE